MALDRRDRRCGGRRQDRRWVDRADPFSGVHDHPHHALREAITIDFVNSALGPSARIAVELTLESAKELSAALARAIAAAEDPRKRPVGATALRRLTRLAFLLLQLENGQPSRDILSRLDIAERDHFW